MTVCTWERALEWSRNQAEPIMWRDKTRTLERKGTEKKIWCTVSGTTTFNQRRVTYSFSLAACFPFFHSLSLIFNPPFVLPSPLFFCRLAVKHRKLWPLHNNPIAGGCEETAWRPLHKQQIGPLMEGRVWIHRRLRTQTYKHKLWENRKQTLGLLVLHHVRCGATWNPKQSAGFNDVFIKSLTLALYTPVHFSLCSK